MSGGPYLLKLSKKVTRKGEIKEGIFRLLYYIDPYADGVWDELGVGGAPEHIGLISRGLGGQV